MSTSQRLKRHFHGPKIGLGIALAVLCYRIDAPANAQAPFDICFSNDSSISDEQRITACSEVLEEPLSHDKSAFTHLIRGMSYKTTGNIFAALDDFDLALVTYPPDELEAEIYIQRGHCYTLLHLFVRAVQGFLSAIAVSPNNGKAVDALAVTRDMGDMMRLRLDIPVKGKAFTVVGTPTSQTGGLVQWYVTFSDSGYAELGKRHARTGKHYAMTRGQYTLQDGQINVGWTDGTSATGVIGSNGGSVFFDGVTYQLDQEF